MAKNSVTVTLDGNLKDRADKFVGVKGKNKKIGYAYIANLVDDAVRRRLEFLESRK